MPIIPTIKRILRPAYRFVTGKSHRKYADRVQSELDYFNAIDVHELPPIFHYWSRNYLLPKIQSLGYSSMYDLFADYAGRAAVARGETCRLLSIGAGDCVHEIRLAQSLIKSGVSDFQFTCLDLNPRILETARANAAAAGLDSQFRFVEIDLNQWSVEEASQDVVVAFDSLHHLVELESLFSKIHRALPDHGCFLISDMIGRNGHQRWPEALALTVPLWRLLEDKYKYNHDVKRLESEYIDRDFSVDGFEGIRAGDILPLLLDDFHFEVFLGFLNVIIPFIDRHFGHNFDPGREWDRNFIDFVARLDDHYMELGTIKPTQMIAVLRKTKPETVRCYKHLTPDFCVRYPDDKQKRGYRRRGKGQAAK